MVPALIRAHPGKADSSFVSSSISKQPTNSERMAQPLPRLDEPDPWVLSGPAAMMADEEECAIFRRFDEFNLLNLLILQDRVQRLSKEFKALFPEKTVDLSLQPPWYAMSSPLRGRNATAGQTEADREMEEKRKEIWNQLRVELRNYSKRA